MKSIRKSQGRSIVQNALKAPNNEYSEDGPLDSPAKNTSASSTYKRPSSAANSSSKP